MSVASNCKATPIGTAGHGSPYLRTADAASYLGIGRSTLERARIRGDGPAYRVLGAKIVVYAIDDLDAYAAKDVRTSTTKCAA